MIKEVAVQCIDILKKNRCACIIILWYWYRLGGGRNQAYSRLSTTHGHITDCKLDSVVYGDIGWISDRIQAKDAKQC